MHENETLKKFVGRETLERRKTTDNELSSFTHQREDDSDELQFFLLKKRFDDLSFCASSPSSKRVYLLFNYKVICESYSTSWRNRRDTAAAWNTF